MKPIKVREKTIGDGFPAFIVAEMAWSHDGSVDNAKKIIKAASDTKADAVKFHITSLEDYMVPQYKSVKGRVSAGKEERRIYDYLESINLDKKDWKELFAYAKELVLLICAMCNDLSSLRFASKLDPDLYDIHLSCLSDEDFIKEVAKEMKPVFLGIGPSTLGEIERAIFWIKETGNQDVALMLNYRQVSKKRTVAKNAIKKNEKITKDKIAFKRSDEGIYPEESKILIGRTAKRNIAKDEPLTWDKIL